MTGAKRDPGLFERVFGPRMDEPSCAPPEHLTAWLEQLEKKLDEALAQRTHPVFFKTHELEIFRRLLGGPYKASSWFSSGLSDHEALQRKIDIELEKRGVPADCRTTQRAPADVEKHFVLSPNRDANGKVVVLTGVSLASGPFVEVYFAGVTTQRQPAYLVGCRIAH